jgi:hypothetical protein
MRSMLRGSAALARLVWWVHLTALRVAGQGELARLLGELCPRVYEPEPAEDEIGTERVVDLYGVSIYAVPTRQGLLIQLNTDDLPDLHAPLHVEVNGCHVGTWHDPATDQRAAGR